MSRESVDVSHAYSIVIDGVSFSVDLLRQMVPREGEVRTWVITEPDGAMHRGKLERSGCVVLFTTQPDYTLNTQDLEW